MTSNNLRPIESLETSLPDDIISTRQDGEYLLIDKINIFSQKEPDMVYFENKMNDLVTNINGKIYGDKSSALVNISSTDALIGNIIARSEKKVITGEQVGEEQDTKITNKVILPIPKIGPIEPVQNLTKMSTIDKACQTAGLSMVDRQKLKEALIGLSKEIPELTFIREFVLPALD